MRRALRSPPTSALTSTLPELTGTSAPFSQTLGDGTSALVTYARSDTSGFTILNIVPYSNIFSGLPQIAVLTLLSGLVVLAVGTIISYRTSARLSAPIEVLYRNYVKSPRQTAAPATRLDQLSRAFSEMYAKADKLEQGLISSYSDSKSAFAAASARRIGADPEPPRGIPEIRHQPARPVLLHNHGQLRVARERARPGRFQLFHFAAMRWKTSSARLPGISAAFPPTETRKTCSPCCSRCAETSTRSAWIPSCTGSWT